MLNVMQNFLMSFSVCNSRKI